MVDGGSSYNLMLLINIASPLSVRDKALMPYLLLPIGLLVGRKGSKLKYYEFWRASGFWVVFFHHLVFCFLFSHADTRMGRFLFSLLQLFAPEVLLVADSFGIYIGSGVIDCCLGQFICLFVLAC